jgi:hypothetical protein
MEIWFRLRLAQKSVQLPSTLMSSLLDFLNLASYRTDANCWK